MNPMRNPVFRGAIFGGSLIALSVPALALRVEQFELPRTVSAAGDVVGPRTIEVAAEHALVRFSSGTDAAARENALRSFGARVAAEMPETGWTLVNLPAGIRVASGLVFLRALPGVLEAQPDRAYRPVLSVNDPLSASQYHLDAINARPAWEYETGSSSRVTIAIIDSGIEGSHADLSGKLTNTVSSYCSPGPSKSIGGDNPSCVVNNPPTAACDHATRVSGVAAATTNNGLAVAGVSWGAQLVSIKIFDSADCNSDCSDKTANGCATDDWAIAQALTILISSANLPAYGRIVANLSLGGSDAACSGTLQTAVTNAYNAGIVVIAASGNGYPSAAPGVNSPGNCLHVIPVGATDSGNNIANFSSRGSQLSNHGFVAPGVGIVTTDVGNGTTSGATGTSFSSPIGAGVAALVLAAKPEKTPDEVETILRGSAVGIGVSAAQAQTLPAGDTSGAGLLNALRAMKLANGTLASYEGDQKVIGFPNPFRPGEHGNATISVPTSLQGKDLKVRIYTIDGQLVRELGTKTTWDGKNDSGNWVASGTYILLVGTDKGTQRGRLAVLR